MTGRQNDLVQDRRAGQTFRFTAEHGKRMRELRERARLSLVELSHVMGRRPGYQTHLKRLESGRLTYPSFALVADFLRACRASFGDLQAVLGAYTGQPLAREPRVRERVVAELKPLGGREAARIMVYDRKVGDSQKPEVRERAARKQAEAAKERRLLDGLMSAEVNRLGVEPTFVVRKVALDYARMVWKAMRLTEGRQREGEESKGKGKGTGQGAEGGAADSEVKVEQAKGRRKTGRPPKTREQRLADARARFLELAPGVLPDKALNYIECKVVDLFDDLHRVKKR